MDKINVTAASPGVLTPGTVAVQGKTTGSVTAKELTGAKQEEIKEEKDNDFFLENQGGMMREPAGSGIAGSGQGIIISAMPEYPRDLFEVAKDGAAKKVTFIYDPDGRKNLKNLTLVGSWDKNTGYYRNDWKDSAVPMVKDKKGRWIATLDLVDDSPHNWRWDVLADGPYGKQKRATFEETCLALKLEGEKPVAEYAPTTYTRMGATKDEENINFKYWAPYARNVRVKIWDKDSENEEFVQLKKDPKTNMWSGGIENGWEKCDGKIYAYEVTTSEGKSQLRPDPYARFRQGQQRGIGEIYLDPQSGIEKHKFWKDWVRMLRFEVQGQENADKVLLKISDENGNQLNKEQLKGRIGEGRPDLVEKFHEGEFNDHWIKNVTDSGDISLVKQGGAWASIIDNPDALIGLGYKFEVMVKDKDGNLRTIGDLNNDGQLSDDEVSKTHYNDPYGRKIEDIGWERFGIIKDPSFDWKNDETPRMAEEKNKMVMYQMHVGSIFGDSKNVNRSTFEDVIDRLNYFKELGVNTIELLPTNSFEGSRDWGYIGTSSFANSDQYGFEDSDGKWVSGSDAVKRFSDAAHGLGFNVINDVVYNHWGGENNHMWEHDGKKNPYFDWDDPPPPKDENDMTAFLVKAVKNTDWGAMPAYNKDAVKQFIVDNAVAQLDEFHFDGLRFDFTHPIHAQGWGGGSDGWNMLRKINREVHFFHPKAITSAEEFPNTEALTEPAQQDGKGGAGFDTMWNTEYQHRLVHDGSNPSILQQAAKGHKTDMDKFMSHLVFHPGFRDHMNSVTVISNHDEVGNADRTINVVMDHQHRLPSQWERNAVRMSFGVGMLSPGIPIFFQGEESMAMNKFSWGRPSTWDVGWDWMKETKENDLVDVKMTGHRLEQIADRVNVMGEDLAKADLGSEDRKVVDYLASKDPDDRQDAVQNVMRRQHHTFCREAIKLRQSSQAFDGDAEVKRVYTHNDNSVMAFSRKKGNDEFLVIGSLNRNNQGDYNIPMDGGKWKLVFNSDADAFGGNNYGGKFDVNGDQGAKFDIPAGGMLVYKRVG